GRAIAAGCTQAAARLLTPGVPLPALFARPTPSEVDLHMHSLHSDGSDAPSELVRQALKTRLKAIAITDHDTITGVPEARVAARGMGLEIVPGVELSASDDRSDVHLLLYD